MFVAAVLAGSCARESAPAAPATPAPDTAVADRSSSPPPDTAADRSSSTPPPDGEAPATGSCLPGATAEDCQRCEYGLDNCKRACPKVDCNVFPVPAACAPFCGGDGCCECRRDVGTEWWWRPPRLAIACGTACGATRAAWQALLKDPRMTACTADADCAAVGGPSPATCNCAPAIGGCFQVANAAAYQSLGAAALEAQYQASCPNEPRICDCAPNVPGCQNGTCVIKKMNCCLCPPDAGQ